MSVADRLLAGERVETDELRVAVSRALFGDYLGATLFLASLAWFGLYWRLGFFSNDQYTFANALVAAADGHLSIDRVVYGPASGASPGTHLVADRVYGRNYGVVIPSLGWLFALEAAALVADLRVLLVGGWSLAVAGAVAGIGTWVDRRRAGLVTGLALAALLFVGNVALATPLSDYWLPQLALQLSTALAAAVVVVATYRLVTRLYGSRVGLFAGLTAAVGTPIGFWATLPKRHSVTAMLVVVAAYALYRSRDARSARAATRFRALTYACAGLAAWVHAAEGLILLVAIATVDLPTARWNRPRDLAVVATAFGVSLLPFLLTNLAISGNPVRPPRLLPDYGGGDNVLAATDADGAPSDSGGSGTGLGGPVGSVVAVVVFAFEAVSALFRLAEESYLVLLTDLGRTARIFVRTGYVPFRPSQDAAINLSVLESMPLLGATLAAPALVVARVRAGVDLRALRPGPDWHPVRVVDVFTAVYAALLVGVFLGRLPIHHMFTYRYLHPLYALGCYWLVRLPAVRRAVRSHGRTLAGVATATVVTGVPAYLCVVALGDYALGEAVQVYALAALGVAAVVACWSLASTRLADLDRAGAVALGVGVGAMATYLLVSGLSLFPVTGEFLLPVSRILGDQFHYARLLGSTPPY